ARFRRRSRPLQVILMHPITQELAIKRASRDGEPRIIALAGKMFIVTPGGETWQVFDSLDSGGQVRGRLRGDKPVSARVFVRTDDDTARIYRFGADEPRSTAARPLIAQLDGATTGAGKVA